MLIKNNTRIITDDGKQTYKSVGFTIHMHNRFFSGSIIFVFKYSHRNVDRKVDVKLKHAVHYIKVRGFDSKFIEFRLVSIPKGK
jgi:hypothetical protein